MRVVPEGLLMTEIAPGFGVRDVESATEAEFIVSPDLKVMLSEGEKAA